MKKDISRGAKVLFFHVLIKVWIFPSLLINPLFRCAESSKETPFSLILVEFRAFVH